MSTYTDQQISDFISHGETQTVEFKTDILRPEILSRLLCAFANTDGGVILVGVDERRGPVGCDSQKMMRLFEAAQRRLREASSASMHFHRLDGVEIAVIRVAKAPRLVSSVDGVFVRRGAATVAMSPDELMHMLTPEPKKSEIEDLITVVSEQTKIIEELRDHVREGSSWKSKAKDYLVGGVIGAILGAVASKWI